MCNEEAQSKFVQLPLTQWSLVLAARDPDSSEGAEALEKLCHIYFYPLYAFVRRQGHVPEDAEDLIQKFFCRVVGKNYLAQAEMTRALFRTFLLVALRHFLANECHRVHAVKRGASSVSFPGGYRAIAQRLGTTETATRSEVNRHSQVRPVRNRIRCLRFGVISRSVSECKRLRI